MNTTSATAEKVVESNKACVATAAAAKTCEFETVAMPHLDDLYRAARHVVGKVEEAEDLVQEAYLQAWKSFHRFEPGTNCRAWLFKILFHVISHHRRKHYRVKWVSDGEELLAETVAYAPPIPEELSDQEVLAAFSKIPEQYRGVVLLADVHELSYAEIAESLDVPIGTVMSRLSRGRKLLRVELAQFAMGFGIQAAAQAML